ncbi:MAG: alpha/beta hydrolase [Pseudomonadota bacterium]
MKVNNKILIVLVATLLIAFAGCSPVQSLNRERVSTVTAGDGSVITYGVRGQGEVTVVFIHCWTCNHEFWRPQIDYFARQHRVVWLDLAGHGLSGSNRREYTMAAFGEDVASVVNEINGDSIVLVGHSMGGPVAIEAAESLGDRVIGIVGVDTFYTPFQYPKSEAKIEAFVKPFKDDYTSAVEQLVRSMFRPEADPELVTSIFEQMSVANREMGIDAMYEIFSWHAKGGSSALDRYSAKLRNINAAPTETETAVHASVTPISGVGHFVAQVKPDEFNEVLSMIIDEYRAD